jgi:hypothetical protein
VPTRKMIQSACLFIAVTVPRLAGQDAPADPQATTPAADATQIFHRIPRGFGLEFQLGSFAGMRAAPTLFSNIPQALRTVPTHPDDGYPPGTAWTIPTASYSMNDPQLQPHIFFSFAPQFTLSRFTVRAGLKIVPAVEIESAKPTAGSTVPEVNQQGTADRGFGESLVYYFLYWSPKASGQTKPFAEAEFRVHRLVSLIGGYDPYRSTFDVLFENGWDRYDAFQTHMTQTLASVSQAASHYYGAIRIALFGPYMGCRVGFSPLSTRVTDLYPGVNPNFPLVKSGGKKGLFFAFDFRLTQSRLPKSKDR